MTIEEWVRQQKMNKQMTPVESPSPKTTLTANDNQVGGTHYSLPIQPWDYTIANNLDYFQGTIVKYITRWRSKNGAEDLEKARHFLEKYIEAVKAGQLH
jgi:hypothetical protein